MIPFPGGKRFRDISELVLDLNADVGVSQSGGFVTGVADQSKYGNDVSAVVNGGYLAPTLVPGSLNGRASIVFSGGSSLGNTTSTSVPCLGPLHLFAVTQALAAVGDIWSNGGVLFFAPYAVANVNGFGLQWGYSGTYTNYYGYNQVSGANSDWFQNAQTNTDPHIVEVHIAAGVNQKPVVRVDGVLQPFVANVASNLSSGNGFSVGGYGLGESPGWDYTGRLRRMLVYKNELSDYEAGVIRHILGVQNGIPVS